jgi:osomolarity two-component system sensor histidine kinase SLN1
MSYQLECLGYSSDVVSTSAAALLALKIRHYRMIFMDMQLPDLDGCETTKLIREAGYTMPIIAVTAEDEGKSLKKCLDAGMSGYLTKPLDMCNLEVLLNSWIMPEDTNQGRKTI